MVTMSERSPTFRTRSCAGQPGGAGVRWMRVVVAAVGRLKAGPDREIAERYRDRAAKVGRALGVRGIEIIEVRESRAREAERRITEEAIALASIVPDGAVTALLDSR